MMPEKHIDYSLTKEAYTAFNLYCTEQIPSLKRLLLFCQFGVPLVVMLLCGVLFLASVLSLALACVISAVTYAIFVLFYPGMFRRGMARRVGRMVSQGMGREFVGEHHMTLLEDCLRDEVNGAVFEVPYINIEKVVENDNHLYVFIGPTSAFMLPVTALGDVGGKTGFLEMLEARQEGALA